MYCLIQEAWPEHNFNPTNNVPSLDIGNEFKPTIQPKHVEHFENKITVLTCNDFLTHIETCESCRMRLLNRTNKITELFELNPQLKETLMIFLIGIVILMILNLLYKD